MSDKAKYHRPTSGPSRGGNTMGLGDVMKSSWPTPQSRDHHGAHTIDYIKNQRAKGNGCSNLNDYMSLSAWSTPRSSDDDKGGPNQNFGAGGTPLPAQMHQATWRSPQNRSTAGGSYSDPEKAAARVSSGHQVNLEDQMVAQWSTPTARDFRSGKASPETHARNARPLNEQMTPPSGQTPSGSSATTEKRDVPNPAFPCWLQGLPEEYLCGGRWVTPSARRSRSK